MVFLSITQETNTDLHILRHILSVFSWFTYILFILPEIHGINFKTAVHTSKEIVAITILVTYRKKKKERKESMKKNRKAWKC